MFIVVYKKGYNGERSAPVKRSCIDIEKKQ